MINIAVNVPNQNPFVGILHSHLVFLHLYFGRYTDCVNAKGQIFSAESLFLILILHEQKMINELMAKLQGHIDQTRS
jgi:hypothetical protein